MTIFNRRTEKEKRVRLRKQATTAECILWSKLRGRQLHGLKFRRQVSVGTYSLDFFCPELRLGIEVDGESHFTETGKKHDKRRTLFLQQYRVRVVRFTNDEVLNNLEGVWQILVKVCAEITPLNPPFPRGDSVRAIRRARTNMQFVIIDKEHDVDGR